MNMKGCACVAELIDQVMVFICHIKRVAKITL